MRAVHWTVGGLAPPSAGREATGGFEPPIGVLQTPALTSWPRRRGAEDGIRTRDLLLGKEMCYHCTTSARQPVRARGLEPPRELAPNSPSSWRVYLIPPRPQRITRTESIPI